MKGTGPAFIFLNQSKKAGGWRALAMLEKDWDIEVAKALCGRKEQGQKAVIHTCRVKRGVGREGYQFTFYPSSLLSPSLSPLLTESHSHKPRI